MSRPASSGIYRTQRTFFRDAYVSGEHGWPTERPTAAMLRFLRKLKKEGVGGRFLDLGCGEGRHLIPFARAGFRCEGLDLEPLALKRARGFLRGAGVAGKVKLRTGDALKLPYPRDSFDVVLDSGCFHHIRKRDERLFIDNVVRVLRPEGQFLLTVFDVNFRHTPEEKPHTRHKWLVHHGHLDRFFTRADLRVVFGHDFRLLDIEKDAKGLDVFWHVRMKRKAG